MDSSASESGAGSRWSSARARIGASIAVGAILLGSGIGIGVALTGGASAATGPAAGKAPGAATGRCAKAAMRLRGNGHPAAGRNRLLRCRAALLRVAAAGVHGEVTYKAKDGFRTIVFERGSVKAVTSAAVTVRAADGTTWTWDIVKNTVVRQSGHVIAASKLTTGEHVLVAGQVTGGARDARLIRIRPAA